MIVQQTLLKVAEKHFDSTQEFPWLQKKLSALATDFRDRTFYLAFSACSRFIEKTEIAFDDIDLAKLEELYPNFSATPWSKDEIARILLMTALPTSRNQQLLETLFGTADYRELIALYKGLYFLENAESFMLRGREGLRTNMVGVFDALALNNPYPAKYLTEDAWNHMVLKAVFMERPIYKVYQIETRKNPKLALIFLDYAHERWSAHRKVTPELWRFISGYVNDNYIKDIQKTILGTDTLERLAATKALVDSDYPKGIEWLMDNNIVTDNLPSWKEIGIKVDQEKTNK